MPGRLVGVYPTMRVLPDTERHNRPRRRKVGGGLGCERRAASALLGEDHPLVGVLRRLETVIEQLLVVAAFHSLGLVLWSEGAPLGPAAAIGALVVEIALGCRLALLIQSRRDLCLGMIVAGRECVSLAVVAREQRRLLSARNRDSLARAVENLARAAERLGGQPVRARPLLNARVVRPAVPQLYELARLLRSEHPSVRGIALIEQLLTAPVSTLYGSDPELLQRELGRASYLLSR